MVEDPHLCFLWFKSLSLLRGPSNNGHITITSVTLQKRETYLRTLKDVALHREERDLRGKLQVILDNEEASLRQKSRVQWLKLGDSNSKFFYRAFKQRCNKNAVHSIMNESGQRIYGDQVDQEPVNFCRNLFNAPFESVDFARLNIHRRLKLESIELLDAIRQSPNNKAPGIYGFTKEFFMAS